MTKLNYFIGGNPVIFPEWCKSEESKQGYFGELYVKYQYEKAGFIVLHSADYDQYLPWDLIVINLKTGKSKVVQVKCITRYVTQNKFGLKLGKKGFTEKAIKESDELILVVRNIDPKYKIDDELAGKVLLIKNHTKYRVIDGQYVIPSNPENYDIIGELTEDELLQASSFKTSK